MKKIELNDLIKRYEAVSFLVNKRAEVLLRDQIGEVLTLDQHFTLRYIKNNGRVNSSELAEVFYVKKSAITAIINRLTHRELITRDRDPNDRRIVYLSLTDKGEDLYSKCEENVHQLVASFITKFDEKEITNFIETYEKLAGVLDHIIMDSKGE